MVERFVSGSAAVQPALIVSYEMFRKFSSLLCKVPNGFLICDEGAYARLVVGEPESSTSTA